MKQLNIIVTPEFERQLKTYMKHKGLKEKTAAIRNALREAVDRLQAARPQDDFRAWLGLALKVPPRKTPQFKSEDDLWS